MLDLLKTVLLIFLYLIIFLYLGSSVLHLFKEAFSFSLSVLIGFFLYHLLFSLVALPCILTGQTLTLLMRIWLPVISVVLLASIWLCRTDVVPIGKHYLAGLSALFKAPSSLLLPCLAILCVLPLLYLSLTAYYMGWDTAFYVRTVLQAVENDSMYTLDAMSGTTSQVLSLRYALSPFYMNSAIFCRLFQLHPLMVQNLADGSICLLLALSVIWQIGLALFKGNTQKACIVMIFASILHLSHSSVFSTSDFLLLRSYEAKAYCSNVILPFIAYLIVRLWKDSDKRSGWILLFISMAASIPISMSSLLTVPVLAVSGSLIWLFTGNRRALRNLFFCLLPNLLYLGVYLLEHYEYICIPIR